MKKRPILNAYETKIFNEWIADGNAVEQTKGVWVEQSTQYRKKFTYEELQKFFKKEYLSYRTGGKIGFDALAKKVAKRYAGEKVEPQYQGEYGKRYSRNEAKEVGRKVAGKVYWQKQGRKFDGGGAVEKLADLMSYTDYRAENWDDPRKKELEKSFFGKNIDVKFKFITGGDFDIDIQDELKKIKLLSNNVDFDKVTGKIDYYESKENTNLKFYKDGKLVMSLKGDWNEESESLDTIIEIDGETTELNYHPFGSLGGVDMRQLKKNINEAFRELNNYSAIVSIEGYEEYAEDVEGLENAKARVQDIKGNTRFQVLKGSSVGIGKRVDNSRVIAEFNGGGGVGDSEINTILEELKNNYLVSRGLDLITDIEQAKNPRFTTYWETIARKDVIETQVYEWLKKYDIIGGFDIIWVGDLEKINNWKTKIKELKSNGYLVVTKISAPTKDRTKHFRYIAIKQKFDNGGSVPNLNKMFHLPIEMAVYVPSTQDVNNVISVDEMDKRVREVKEYLANKFGGYTSAEKIGGFVDSQAELVNEEVVQITAFSTKEAYEENKEALVQKLSEWAKEWGQEAIGFEYEGDLMYVPQKFVGGGKAIRQTHYAVYKLLDKEGLVKYFTDKDLEKFLEEWNEDYNTDYEDFVEFNEYERDFIIKPVFSKNDMGGTASQPSFLEIQINDVTNWENYELANYLDVPISLVEKNRNFYVREVQNEMMLNDIPTYMAGGRTKIGKYHPLSEYYEKYTNGGFVGGDIIKFKYDGKDFTRKVESVDEMGNAIVNIMKTQKATINPADVFEIKKEKDDKSIIIEKIGLNEENANFLIGLSPTFAVWLADSIVDAYTTIEGEEGLTREQSLNILNKNPRLLTQLRERIRGILDWLQHPTTRKQNLRELTFVEAERKAKEWHDELQTAGGDIDFVEPIENTIITEYPENDNGVKYYWVFIPKGYCDVESARMGHCGRTGAGSLISLRSIRPYTEGTTITDSHVTIAYNKEEGLFYQSKGKRNAKPSEKYFPYIFDLIKMMASGQVTEKFKLSQQEKIKELEGQKIELEKEVNKLQKYFESREAIEEDTNVLVDKAIIFLNEKDKLQNINSQIEKLNEESSFDFNGFGSEYQSSNDYGYEDMTNEQVKELYEIKPDMFNDFAGQFMLYEAGLIDEKPNTSFLLEKGVDYVVDLLRVDRNTSDSLVTQVLRGETYDLIDAGYYYENAGDYVEQLKGVDYESVLDKIVEITGYDKEEVKENGAEYYLNGEDENFDSDSFDDIKRAIGNALAVATENDYAGYLRNQIVSALEELGTIEKLDDTGVVLNIDLSNLLSMSQISAISRELESNSVEDIFFEAESQGEIELPLLKIDDRYDPYPENWQEYFDINNYEEGGVIYQDLSKIKPMVVNDNTVLTEFEVKKSKSGVEINDKIMNSDDVVNILRKIWEEDTINAYEQAYVLFMNKNNKVIGYYHHSNGGIDGTIMDVQMISGMAVKSLAKGVIIAHNHPSGSTNPSDADNKITKQLSQALDLFNIQLLDSIILTEKSYLSFANEGLI